MRIGKLAILAPACLLSALTLCAQSAQAQFFNNTTGLSSPGSTITFNEVALTTGNAVTNQFQPYGATFANLLYDSSQSYGQSGSIGFSGASLTNITPNSNFIPGPFTITFNQAVNAAAFAIVDQSNTYTFTASLHGTMVDSGSLFINFNPGAGFVGFQNETFDQITFNNVNGSAFAIDTLQFTNAAVPEPGSVALLVGMGVSSLFAVRRLRRRKK